MKGWRFGRASRDSYRLQTMRTGCPVVHASSAAYGSTVMSSLPPKPPPRKGATTRTRLCGRPSTAAISRKCSMTWEEARTFTTPWASTQATPASGSR